MTPTQIATRLASPPCGIAAVRIARIQEKPDGMARALADAIIGVAEIGDSISLQELVGMGFTEAQVHRYREKAIAIAAEKEPRLILSLLERAQ